MQNRMLRLICLIGLLLMINIASACKKGQDPCVGKITPKDCKKTSFWRMCSGPRCQLCGHFCKWDNINNKCYKP